MAEQVNQLICFATSLADSCVKQRFLTFLLHEINKKHLIHYFCKGWSSAKRSYAKGANLRTDSFLIFMKIGTALDISFANTTRGHFTPLGTFLLKTNGWNRPQNRRKWKHLFRWRTNASLMLHSHGRRKMGNSRQRTAAGWNKINK